MSSFFSKPNLKDNFTSALFNDTQGHTIQNGFLLYFDGTIINRKIEII